MCYPFWFIFHKFGIPTRNRLVSQRNHPWQIHEEKMEDFFQREA